MHSSEMEPMIWLVVTLGCALAFAVGWIAYRKPDAPSGPSAAEKEIAASFDKQKAAVSKESDAQLLADLNSDIRE